MRFRWAGATAGALCLAVSLMGHMVSISTCDLRVEGMRARYELSVPAYEAEHLKRPEIELLENIRFLAGGAEGRRLEGQCRPDPSSDSLKCEALYEFDREVETVEVVCNFHKVLVQNHAHILRAASPEGADRAVLDFTFPRTTLRFRPPGAGEVAIQGVFAGLRRALGGAAQLLFLVAMALAARRRGEFLALAAAFLAGQAAACLLAPRIGWQPAPGFVEAAAALTIAYLAVEILLFPTAGYRALVVGILGLFHGLYFATFLAASEAPAAWFLLGASLAEFLALVVLYAAGRRLGPLTASLHPQRALAGALLAVGMGWFLYRIS